MSALSDPLLVVAILSYVAAMVCHAAEYAFGNRSHIGRAAQRPARELVAVGDGGSTLVDDFPPVMKVPEAPPRRDRAALAGIAAVAVTALAALVHLGTLVTRGVAAERMPWGNMYEFVL